VAEGGSGTIDCAAPGDLCADTERQCLCGDPDADGQVWLCVPVNAGCPEREPAPSTECEASATSATCNYVDSGIRTACHCAGSSWQCVVSLCGYTLPTTGSACNEVPGTNCDFFVPATPARPEDASSVTCTCGTDASWTCP
jgi:hypothetical protein